MLLGTRSDCQGQGLGRTMLRYLFGFARDRGYASVVLEADSSLWFLPKRRFRSREGDPVADDAAVHDASVVRLSNPQCFYYSYCQAQAKLKTKNHKHIHLDNLLDERQTFGNPVSRKALLR